MTPIAPGSAPIALSPRLRLQPAADWQGRVQLAPQQPPAVLSDSPPPPVITAPLSLSAPAEPPIVLEVQRRPGPAVLSDSPPSSGALEYQPPEPAVYALLHEIHTPDGIIYDLTLPERAQPGRPNVLSDEPALPAVLRFPVNPLVGEGGAPAAPRPAVLGIEELARDALAGVVTKRVLQVLRSPLDSALLSLVRRFEPEPRVLALRDGGFQPLSSAEEWRALLPPGRVHRVLLYIHGFGSSTASSGGAKFVPALASGYDAVLSYDHPTVTRTPLENAADLLAQIPADLRLAADLVAHSRGGLVARSLIELGAWPAKLKPRRLLTAGTPHAGTRLADPVRWDRLVSVGLTLGSWLLSAGGGAFWAPQLLELVLKAAAQSTFDLPGIAAMTPGNDFLAQLNGPNRAGLNERVRYAAVTSDFAPGQVAQLGFRQAFSSFAMQVFMGEPNDLVVHTASALEIDAGSRTFAPDQQLRASVDHSNYYQDSAVQEFVRKHLRQA